MKKTPYAMGAERAAEKRPRSPPIRLGTASRQAWCEGYDTEIAYQKAQMEMFDAREVAPQTKKPAYKGDRSLAPRSGTKRAVHDGANVPRLRAPAPATEA